MDSLLGVTKVLPMIGEEVGGARLVDVLVLARVEVEHLGIALLLGADGGAHAGGVVAAAFDVAHAAGGRAVDFLLHAAVSPA